MGNFKRRQRHSMPFFLFLAAAGAMLVLSAGSSGAGETVTAGLSGTNLQSPLSPLANSSWTGTLSTQWSNAGNWTAGVPTLTDFAFFDANFTSNNQPNLTANASVGAVDMTSTVTKNVTITGSELRINGVAGTGILLENSAFTLTIDSNVRVDGAQTWTNNSILAGNPLTVSGNVNLNNQALSIGGVGNTLISGVISSGGGSLTQDGTGTTTITGKNTYGAGTTINAGTLLVNGDSSGANGLTTVNSGGTLGGNGTVGGAVTVNSGGNLAPGTGGNTIGILTEQGALTLQSGSNFRIDINGTGAGTGHDQLISQNSVTLNGGNLLVHVGGTLMVGQTFDILNKTSGGAIVGTFAGAPQGGFVTGDDGTVFQISYTSGAGGNDVVLTVITAAVPEPSTWMGGALAIAGLAFTQRRRLRKLIARRCPVSS